MKITTMLIGLAAIIVLAACASQSGIYSQQSIQNGAMKNPTSVNTSQTALAQNYQSIADQVKADTIAKNDKYQQIVLPYKIKYGKIGDYIIFGLIYNPLNEDKQTIDGVITFIGARDSNNNMIEGDSTYMGTTWIKTQQIADFYVLQQGNSTYIPLIFTIGNDIAQGVPTVPGTYQFEIQFYNKNTYGGVTKLDSQVEDIYIKVQ